MPNSRWHPGVSFSATKDAQPKMEKAPKETGYKMHSGKKSKMQKSGKMHKGKKAKPWSPK